ncbi:hypothetical protein [Nocardioides sp.]|uniref:hypothetical protein n=1 Tax=Nocardioides sp. TaxID=35761 RepID=UPI00378445E5
MDGRIDAVVLWARASCAGLRAFGLGVVGHVMADGLLPGPVLLAALLLASVALSAPVLARPASSVRLVALLVAGQTVIHLVLAVSAGHRGDAPGHPVAATLPPTGRLPVVDGHRVGSLQDLYQGGAGSSPATAPTLPVGHLLADLSAHAPMMAVHLVAAALVGLWLASGERCLWALLALTGRRIMGAARTLAGAVVVPTPVPFEAPVADPVGGASRWQARPHSRRGPPLLAR